MSIFWETRLSGNSLNVHRSQGRHQEGKELTRNVTIVENRSIVKNTGDKTDFLYSAKLGSSDSFSGSLLSGSEEFRHKVPTNDWRNTDLFLSSFKKYFGQKKKVLIHKIEEHAA